MAAPMRRSVKHLKHIHVQTASCCKRHLSCTDLRSSSTSAVSVSEERQPPLKSIVIPKRKERDDYSVLRLLSRSARKTLPNYGYVDDPFLLPVLKLPKRKMMLSKLSGQHAARTVLEKFPNVFDEQKAVPAIPDFMTKEPVRAVGSVEGVEECIRMCEPLLGYTSYEQCKRAGVEVPEALELDLFELLCFYNSKEPPPEPVPEVQYDMGVDGSSSFKVLLEAKRTWLDEGVAEEMFISMAKPTARAYNALIRGRLKYFQLAQGRALFFEAAKKNIPLTVETYNAILKTAVLGVDQQVDVQVLLEQRVLNTLKAMAKRGVRPNVDTINHAIAFALAIKNRRDPAYDKYLYSLLAEMHELQIEPNLSTYHFTNLTVIKSLQKILVLLRNKELQVNSVTDLDFAHSAMLGALNLYRSLPLAREVERLMQQHLNYRALGDAERSNIYYTMYIYAHLEHGSLDQALEEFYRITPYQYQASFKTFEAFLNKIEEVAKTSTVYQQYLVRLYQAVKTNNWHRKSPGFRILKLMAKEKVNPDLQDLYVSVATDLMLNHYQDLVFAERKGRFYEAFITGDMLGDCIDIFLNGDLFEYAWDCLLEYNHKKNNVYGSPSEKSLVHLIDECIKLNNTDNVLTVLKVMGRQAMPLTNQMIARAHKELLLTDDQLTEIAKI